MRSTGRKTEGRPGELFETLPNRSASRMRTCLLLSRRDVPQRRRRGRRRHDPSVTVRRWRTSALSKLRILRAVPVLLVLGLLVHFLLPRLDTVEDSLKTLWTMAPRACARDSGPVIHFPPGWIRSRNSRLFISL